jgi:hypothetical protein
MLHKDWRSPGAHPWQDSNRAPDKGAAIGVATHGANLV